MGEQADVEFGHRHAMHLILERLLVRVFEDDPVGLADLEAECMASVDNLPRQWTEGEKRGKAEHMSNSVQAIFSGARRLLEAD
jgi:hypothetical protein